MGILSTLASFHDSTMVAVGDGATSSFWSIAIKDHAMASHKLVTLKPTGFTETDDEETAAIRTVIDAAEINWGGSLSGGGHAGGRFGSHFDPGEKSARSDLQGKTGEPATTSAKKTIATADALGAVPKPRYQNRQPPDGVAVVSGAVELKVIRTKTKKKQKTAGATGSGNTNCAGYDFQVPFDPSCYNSFEFGVPTWAFDPYNMYFMLNMPSSSYPMGLYNVNGFSNLPLHAPGMQGYPASHYSREFQPTLHRDRKASAHARQAESSKGTGTQPHKSDRCTPAWFWRGGMVALSLMIMMKSSTVGSEHVLQGVQRMLITVEVRNHVPGTPTGGMHMKIQLQAVRKATSSEDGKADHHQLRSLERQAVVLSFGLPEAL